MKRNKIFICSIISLVIFSSITAQKITYGVRHNESARETNFEILGKVGPNYIVFKNIAWRNIIQVFDKNMDELSNERLKYIPEKIINVDFVTYVDDFLMIYQYKDNGIVFCDAVKLNAKGEKISEIVRIDTTRVGTRIGSGIYNTTFSEDKQRILIYKIQSKEKELTLVTKQYNPSLQMQDSTRSLIEFDNRREAFSPIQIANDGSIFLTREIKKNNRENVSQLEIVTNVFKSNTFKATPIDLQNKFIDDIQIKVDNRNNSYILNAFYFEDKRAGSIEGLYSVLVDKITERIRFKFNRFDDTLRTKMNPSQFRTAFDNLFLKNTFVRRDGGFVLIAEDFASQSIGNYNNWNRWDYLYGSPYGFNDNFYNWNSPYNRYNRFNSFNNSNSTRYYYDNILVVSFDSTLNLNWSNVILKKQSDDDNDSYLSYGTMNVGAEVNFLYIEKEKNAQIISNQSISTYGKLYRYPTLKSREAGYMFMPRLSKQVGLKEIIMPSVYRGNISFAKIEF
ncbi:MAG: hypothetical protein WEA59_09440 [Ferruginibacter sp.]